MFKWFSKNSDENGYYILARRIDGVLQTSDVCKTPYLKAIFDDANITNDEYFAISDKLKNLNQDEYAKEIANAAKALNKPLLNTIFKKTNNISFFKKIAAISGVTVVAGIIGLLSLTISPILFSVLVTVTVIAALALIASSFQLNCTSSWFSASSI